MAPGPSNIQQPTQRPGARSSLHAIRPPLQTGSQPTDQQSLNLSCPEVVVASGSSIPLSVTARSDAWESHFRPQPSQAPQINSGESLARELEDVIRLSDPTSPRREVRSTRLNKTSLIPQQRKRKQAPDPSDVSNWPSKRQNGADDRPMANTERGRWLITIHYLLSYSFSLPP